MNIKNIVEAYAKKAEQVSSSKQNIKELDKKLEKLLLSGEKKSEITKEK